MPDWDDPLLLWNDTDAVWNDTAIGAWGRHADRAARTPCMVVEIDLDWIDDGGVTATNPDGSLCYRTPATTDQGTFTVTTKTRKYQTSSVRPIPELRAIPCVESVKLGTDEVKIGRGLGYFGSAAITFRDFVDDDSRAEDPFSTDASRTGLDLTAGTYLGKLLERNPWWTNRAVRIHEGWATSGKWWPTQVITHNFFVRDVQGPNDGKVTITVVGPLQLVNLTDAEAPAPSEGVLEADILAAATSARIYDPVLAAEYPASGYVRIGDEVMSYARSGQDLTLTRGEFGTIAEGHNADDSIQVCLRYESQPLTTIVSDLLTTYGGVDPALIDTATWASEQSTWLSLYLLSGTVSQPTKVLDLVQELLEASGSILWWDDQEGLIRFKAVRPALVSAATWTDSFHLLSRPVVRTEAADRVSRCDVAIDLRSADKDPKNLSSYRARVVGVPAGEEATQHGSPKVRVIASRWLSASQGTLAIRASWLVTSQLRDGRKTIMVEVSAKDATLGIGEVVSLQSRDFIDRTGTRATVRGIVIKREPILTGSKYRYTLERMAYAARYIYLCPTGLPNYTSATAAQRDPGWFLADTGGVAFGPDDPAFVLG